jgi:hypothetical protein
MIVGSHRNVQLQQPVRWDGPHGKMARDRLAWFGNATTHLVIVNKVM